MQDSVHLVIMKNGKQLLSMILRLYNLTLSGFSHQEVPYVADGLAKFISKMPIVKVGL